MQNMEISAILNDNLKNLSGPRNMSNIKHLLRVEEVE